MMNAAFGREEATRTPDPHVPNVVRYQLRYFSILLRKIFGIAWDFVVFKVGKQGTPPSFTPENNLIPSRILVAFGKSCFRMSRCGIKRTIASALQSICCCQQLD